jgi:hypothetical protein
MIRKSRSDPNPYLTDPDPHYIEQCFASRIFEADFKIHIQILNFGFGFKSGSVIATDPHLLGKGVFYTLLPLPPTQSFFHIN